MKIEKLYRELLTTLVISLLIINGYSITANTAVSYLNVRQDDKRALYIEHIKKGDKFLAEKNYAAAMFEYEKAAELMPYEEEPKLKMQSIEATLGTKELAEVKKKVEQAKREEAEQLRKAKEAEAESAKPVVQEKEGFESFLVERQKQSARDSIRQAIFDAFAEELKIVEQGNDMLARSAVYRKIADAFKEARDEEIAIKYYQKALEIEQEYGKQEDVSTVYEDIADAYYESGDFQNSINSYEKSLSVKQKAGDKAGVSKVLSNIAGVYETTYDYKNAIDYYQQSAKLKDSIADESGLKDVMDNLGNVYYKQKVLTSAILSYEKAEKIIKKLDIKEALGPVYNKLGVAYYEMGNLVEAEKFFKESRKNLYETGNRKEAAMAENNLGNLLFINNKYEEAIEYYERSLASKKTGDYEYGRAVTMFNMGNAYRRSGNHEKALELYEESKRISDSLEFTTLSAKNLKALAAVYNAVKQFEKAELLEKELDTLELSSSISIEFPVSENEMDLDIKKTQEILSKLSEEALKRKDIVEAESNNKMADLYINTLNKQYMKEQSRSRTFLILSVVLGAVLLLTIILAVRSSRKNKGT
ncbi:MAG: tetratricopeptide repeat protein [Bacteroidales bacterium]|nr:tetratricopeptide repeat protein [Bacteroidales bacterium]MBN2763940.1 tetratricopeptide repeat protein [Bacteroidales bacterium]